MSENHSSEPSFIREGNNRAWSGNTYSPASHMMNTGAQAPDPSSTTVGLFVSIAATPKCNRFRGFRTPPLYYLTVLEVTSVTWVSKGRVPS